MEAGYGHCMMGVSEVESSKTKANVCLILLDSSAEVPPEEMVYLRFLRTDLFERGVKTFLILVGSSNRHSE